MNAVKRCLILLAVALVAGACGGDPSAEDAGTGLTIRATPSSVWMRDKANAEILLEAVDKLGGSTLGSWEVTGTTGGIFTVAEDTAYQHTSAGQVGVKKRFVITTTGEGDGSVSFSGTGGDITIPVRVAPDTLGLDLVFSAPVQVGDTVTVPLNASVTAGLQPGLRFSSNTTVILYTGPLTRDTSIFRPINFTIAADSTHLTFTPGPNSTGRARITGIANTSTPGLSTFARTAAILKTDQFDTAGSNKLTLAPSGLAIGDSVTVTLPATYRFSPNTTVNHFTQQSNGGTTNTNGQATPVVLNIAADSGTLRYLVPPGASGQPRFTNIRVRNNTVFVFAARAADSLAIPAIPSVAVTYSVNPTIENQKVTITAPAGTKFRPGTRILTAGVTLPALVTGRSADSTQITFYPAPGFDTLLTLDSLQDSRVGVFNLTLRSSTKLKTSSAVTAPNALPNLGTDDAAASPSTVGVIALPAMAVGDTLIFMDLAGLTGGDWFDWTGGGTGHTGSQDWKLTVTTTGTYRVTLQWDNTADIDFGIFTAGLGCCVGGTGGMASGNPEVVAAANLVGGTTYFIGAGLFSGAKPQAFRILVRRTT